MKEANTTTLLEKSCVIWSRRRERNIAVRVYYDLQEQDGCKIYTLHQLAEQE
jgi:hypothetical protein